MCGICGSTGDPTGARVLRMSAALVHRGPDDDGMYCDPRGRMSLGARRLSIIDVEGGHQPVANEDGTIWATLNGELYNFPSLRRHLLGRGHQFKSRSDTELLVHLYEDYGLEMPQAIDGMFSFALWDERAGTLLLARDRFGEKPLFYLQRGGEFAFASEATGLTAGGLDPGDLEPATIDEFFVHGYVPHAGTLFRDVRELAPGQMLVWNAASGTSEIRTYWEPPRITAPAPDPEPELVEECERLLRVAVRSRLLADVPVGVFLSGGVDSTLLAAYTAASSDQTVHTYTVSYDVGTVSEGAAARRTAQELGAEHRELVLTESDAAELVPEVLGRLDMPLADQAVVAMYALARFARGDVKAVVAGEGADELFGGYPRYRWLAGGSALDGRVPFSASWQSLPASLPRGRKLALAFGAGSPWERNLDWMTGGRRHLRHHLYGPQLRRFIPGGVGATDGVADGATHGSGAELVRELMHYDQQHWLPYDVLVKADRGGMLASLEVRSPYLQRELAEFAAMVPAGVHMRQQGKWLLRQQLRATPYAGRRRQSKTAFRIPAGEWLRGPLVPLLESQLRDGASFGEGWFDRSAVRAIAEAHRSGRADWTNALWPILAFGLWLDRIRGDRAG
jgi:asparagine synthase (glutamine-hydrolysing)